MFVYLDNGHPMSKRLWGRPLIRSVCPVPLGALIGERYVQKDLEWGSSRLCCDEARAKVDFRTAPW